MLMMFYLLGSCAVPLGLGWDNKLPDSAFSASSELSPGRTRGTVSYCAAHVLGKSKRRATKRKFNVQGTILT